MKETAQRIWEWPTYKSFKHFPSLFGKNWETDEFLPGLSSTAEPTPPNCCCLSFSSSTAKQTTCLRFLPIGFCETPNLAFLRLTCNEVFRLWIEPRHLKQQLLSCRWEITALVLPILNWFLKTLSEEKDLSERSHNNPRPRQKRRGR